MLSTTTQFAFGVLAALHAPHRPAAPPRARPAMAADDNFSPGDMELLASRIEGARTASMPEAARVLILDSMVPGQRLELQAPDVLVQTLKDFDGSPLVMFGRERSSVYTHGVEVRVARCDARPDGDSDVELVAGRYCELESLGEDEGSLWRGRDAKVRWLPLDTDEPDDQPSELLLQRSGQLEELVERWIDLVRKTRRERAPGQLDQVLKDLGPMPPRPNERALWVAGLINPLPALGVALEVRPAALMAKSTERRLAVAQMGIVDSIARLTSDL